jgi:hypothetical protein
MFLFLGALPCTEWLGDAVARDESGFILTRRSRARRQPDPRSRIRAVGDVLPGRAGDAPPPSAKARWLVMATRTEK